MSDNETPHPLVNPSGHEPEFRDDSDLIEAGVTAEELDHPKNVGIVVLQPPSMGRDAAVEAGLTILLVNDEPHEPGTCPPGPHQHEHHVLASGRITYNKALNLAAALVQMSAQVSPLDSTETGIVERINKRIAEEIDEAMKTHVHGIHERGPFDVI